MGNIKNEQDSEFSKQAKGNLRIIKTAWNHKEMNQGVDDGFIPHMVDYYQSAIACTKLIVFQDTVTGKVKFVNDFRSAGESYVKNKKIIRSYPEYTIRKTILPFAAYLLPPDIEYGEMVIIEDLIENIVEKPTEEGDIPLMKSCLAMWTGEKFIFPYNHDGTKNNEFKPL